jgi:hypothetical protein
MEMSDKGKIPSPVKTYDFAQYKPYVGQQRLRAALKDALTAVRGTINYYATHGCPNHKKLFLKGLSLLEPALAHVLYLDDLTDGKPEGDDAE